jgi:hypothetical protein
MAGKTFILSDESVNNYGYRVLTSGIDLEGFKKNPIMLWNHSVTWRGTKDEMLPIGRWDNVRVDGDRLLADAVFDDGDDFAGEILRKVEKGILNMASIGIAVTEQSEDKDLILPGQRYSTVTRCRLREASIVDIGGNRNAVALYDEGGNIVELSDGGGQILKELNDNFNNKNMKIIALTLGLAEAATHEEIVAAIKKLQDESKEAVGLREKIEANEKAKRDAQTAEAKILIDAALRDGKIDAKAKESWESLFAGNFDSAKATLSAIQGRTALRSQVVNTGGGSKYAGKTWDELDRSNRLAQLREDDPDLYAEMFKEKFGK